MFLVFNITVAFWKTKKNNNRDKRKEQEKIYIFLGKLVPSPSLISFFQNKKNHYIGLYSDSVYYLRCPCVSGCICGMSPTVAFLST